MTVVKWLDLRGPGLRGSEVVTEIQVRDQVDKCMWSAGDSLLDTERMKLEDTGWNMWSGELEETSGQTVGVWQYGPATKHQIRNTR